jgi:hypothetical protein
MGRRLALQWYADWKVIIIPEEPCNKLGDADIRKKQFLIGFRQGIEYVFFTSPGNHIK